MAELPASSDRRPQVGVGVAVRIDGRYVLLRRRGAHGAGTWSFPGGKLDFGESILACARRETREEIGVELVDACVLPVVTEDLFPDDNLHFVTLYVHGRGVGTPRICEPDKADDLVVAEPSRFPTPLFCGIVDVRRRGFLD